MDRHDIYRAALLSYTHSVGKKEYEQTMNVLYHAVFLSRCGHGPGDTTALCLALPIIQIVVFGIADHEVRTNGQKLETFLDRLPMKAVEYIFGGDDMFRIVRRFEVQYKFITAVIPPYLMY